MYYKILSMRCLIHLSVYETRSPLWGLWNPRSLVEAPKTERYPGALWSCIFFQLTFTAEDHSKHIYIYIRTYIYIYMNHRMLQLKVYVAYQIYIKSSTSIHRFNYPLHVYSNFVKFQWLKPEFHSRGMCQIVCRCFFSLKAGEYYLIPANLVILFSKAGVSL